MSFSEIIKQLDEKYAEKVKRETGLKFVGNVGDTARLYLLLSDYAQLKQFAKEAVKVVEFYGNDNHWSKPYIRQGKVGRQVKSELHCDGGKTARQFQNSDIYKQVKEGLNEQTV